MSDTTAVSNLCQLCQHPLKTGYVVIDGMFYHPSCATSPAILVALVRKQRHLLDECEKALEAIVDFRASRTFSGSIVGIDEQYPDVVIAMKALAKLRAAQEKADESKNT